MLKKLLTVLSPAQLISAAYFVVVILVGLLLMLPISLKAGVSISPLDAMFTSVSAISVTGLTTVGTGDTFSGFGIAVLLVAFQFGAIGIMTLGAFYWMLMGQHIGLLQRKLIMIDQNRNNLAGLVELMRLVLLISLSIELIGTALFAVYFYASGYSHSVAHALYYGLFHAVSSYTNAGFDLFGDSLIRYSGSFYIQVLSMALIFSGAIGFPVMAELWHYLRRPKGKRFRFSLFTKLTLVTHAVLLFGGAFVILLTETGHSFSGLSPGRQVMNALFLSVTARSAGLTTVDVSTLHQATLLLVSGLMFIGASPSSVGGGVRTTTIAVIFVTIVMFFRGEQTPRAFGRSFNREDVTKSFVFFMLSLLLVTAGIFALLISEQHKYDLSAVIFEVASAFGTCGMSTGITASLHPLAKVTLMLLMYFGRIGMFLFISLFQARKKQTGIKYPEEKLIIG
ncbi:Trk-type K+ transport system, membrane component [Paenibacillus sp. UNC496MF]|uniref:TrkH family potassium uptake protein n=1 Tax=Paenibacillus sp. UNC496MF TaxID=1502753 RepID=UPI0008E9F602|nr:potassium transporter TrkG [Paenibacillus sp. UNC496MF]SFI89791.1 Trk-type K+ transport system, membrane component [Paenibacillus sp. UNC496MF]